MGDNLLSRIFVVEFGVFVAAGVALLAWQVGRGWRRRGMRLRADEGLLLAGALVVCTVCLVAVARTRGAAMPGVGWVWVAAFGACCAVHVGSKLRRILRKREHP